MVKGNIPKVNNKIKNNKKKNKTNCVDCSLSIPFCKHGRMKSWRVKKKNKNVNRYFYSCRKCSKFQWITPIGWIYRKRKLTNQFIKKRKSRNICGKCYHGLIA